MKYYLITHSSNPDFANQIYELINKTNKVIDVIALRDSVITSKGNQHRFKIKLDKWKNVTGVYKKIKTLCNEYGNSYGSLSVYTKIENIMSNFEEGIYPTKSEFKFMNQIYDENKNA